MGKITISLPLYQNPVHFFGISVLVFHINFVRTLFKHSPGCVEWKFFRRYRFYFLYKYFPARLMLSLSDGKNYSTLAMRCVFECSLEHIKRKTIFASSSTELSAQVWVEERFLFSNSPTFINIDTYLDASDLLCSDAVIIRMHFFFYQFPVSCVSYWNGV